MHDEPSSRTRHAGWGSCHDATAGAHPAMAFLVALAVDELGQVWAVIFTLVAIGGGVFAQLGPRGRQPAYCAMSDVALRAVTSLSNSSRIAAGSSPNSMFVPPVSRKRAFAEPW